MQLHFNLEVDKLKSSLLQMASLVDQQVDSALNALENAQAELFKEIKAKDLEIDAYDNLIQTQCANIFALFQPVASDLRFIMSALMINNQLERCGDIAVNIAQRVKKTTAQKALIEESQIVDMGKQAKDMLKRTIDAFINNDIELANKVIDNDDIVDGYNKKIFKFLITKMQSNSELIEPCSHLLILSRHIERLADHAANISEDILFLLEARVASHQKKLTPPKDEN